VTDPLDTLRALSLGQHSGRVAEYRALWNDLWDLRAKYGTPAKVMNEEVRAMVLGFLVDGVPVETARMITLEFMKGMSE
jgi:hypothetical protein